MVSFHKTLVIVAVAASSGLVQATPIAKQSSMSIADTADTLPTNDASTDASVDAVTVHDTDTGRTEESIRTALPVGDYNPWMFPSGQAQEEHDTLHRRQNSKDKQDVSKPIDFTRLTPCIEKCFRKHGSTAPKSLNKVSVKEWCDDKFGAWLIWLTFGPFQCLSSQCPKSDAPISRNWVKLHCGR